MSTTTATAPSHAAAETIDPRAPRRVRTILMTVGALGALGVAASPAALTAIVRLASRRSCASSRALGNGNAKTGAVNAVIGARVEAKDARDFTRADALRAALGSVGVTVKDAKDGATWTVDI